MKTFCHHYHHYHCAACQVTLTVIYPEAFIHGGEEYHVDAGSPVALACVIGEHMMMVVTMMMMVVVTMMMMMVTMMMMMVVMMKFITESVLL